MKLRVVLFLAATSWALAQWQPDGAHVNLYFPHFADGGSATQRWQTTFTFVNVGQSDASVSLWLHKDDGKPLSMDFGAGAAESHNFTVPAMGVRILKSRMTSEAIVTGSATAVSTVPLQATVAFREFENGIPKVEITAQPTLPGLDYVSPANKFMGVAIANTYYDAPVSVDVTVYADARIIAGPSTITVPANGHTSFNLGSMFPGLTDAPCVLVLSGVDRPLDTFVAWTVNADSSGIISSLPAGTVSWPLSHWDRIWLVYQQISEAALNLGALNPAPKLDIGFGKTVNAAAMNGSTLSVTLGLSQLMSDSPAELAWTIAHQFGHIYQQRNGKFEFNPDPESDADMWGTLLSLAAGYDPYAAAGALAKLSMATGSSGLATQFENQPAAEAHKSLDARLENVFSLLTSVCNSPGDKAICASYKSLIHPELPDVAPLRTRPAPVRERAR